MRPEPGLTELIEKYLHNELSAEEKADFEKRLGTDATLRQEVALQREVMEGVQRAALRQRAQEACKQYNLKNNFFKYGLSTIVVILVSAAVLYFAMNSRGSKLPELNENGEKVWADADKHLPGQMFTIDAGKDTVIVTEGGIVMAVPASCFLDASGHPALGKIEIEVKEALDAASIMKGGLSTTSNGKLLETGGMFYLNARKDGNSLKINANKGVYAEVPARKVKEGMMLFDGKRMPDGSIDWQDPKPLETFLTPVDVNTLDFYPPDYLDSLRAMGYDAGNRKFTDSLYYSFAFQGVWSAPQSAPATPLYDTSVVSESAARNPDTVSSHTYGYTPGIDPARVKAIWSTEFNNTLIATREFEKRMAVIHRTCDEHILDLYVSNLDKRLCTIDSMAAKMAGVNSKAFHDLAKHGDGWVKQPAPHLEKLKDFYEKRSKAFKQAIAETQKKFWEEQTTLNTDAAKKHSGQQERDINREAQNFNEELNENLEEAYKQLGIPRNAPPPPSGVYRVTITETGWKNVDVYVVESTLSRTTLDYTDPATGKKAVIKYEPLSVRVNDMADYDRVCVYLVPNKLSSFMRLKQSEGKFSENLSELMQYQLVVMGWKNDKTFFNTMVYVEPREYSISLEPISEGELLNRMNDLDRNIKGPSFAGEAAYQKFAIKEVKRQQHLAKIIDLRERIRPVIFPCGTTGVACNTSDITYANGQKLFKQNCAVCHSTGSNIITGPGMAGVTSRVPGREWLQHFIKNSPGMKMKGDPYATQIDKLYAGTMTSFTFLSNQEVDDIIEYIICISATDPGIPAPTMPGPGYLNINLN